MHDIKLLIKFLVIHIFCYSILLSENSFENKNLKFELTDGETLEEYFGKLKKFIDYYKKDDISLSINDKTSFVRKQSIKIKTDYFFEKKSDQFTDTVVLLIYFRNVAYDDDVKQLLQHAFINNPVRYLKQLYFYSTNLNYASKIYMDFLNTQINNLDDYLVLEYYFDYDTYKIFENDNQKTLLSNLSVEDNYLKIKMANLFYKIETRYNFSNEYSYLNEHFPKNNSILEKFGFFLSSFASNNETTTYPKKIIEYYFYVIKSSKMDVSSKIHWYIKAGQFGYHSQAWAWDEICNYFISTPIVVIKALAMTLHNTDDNKKADEASSLIEQLFDSDKGTGSVINYKDNTFTFKDSFLEIRKNIKLKDEIIIFTTITNFINNYF